NFRLSPADQISELSRSLQITGKTYFQLACEQLKADALAGHVAPVRVPDAGDFFSSEDSERCVVTGATGDQVLFLVRNPQGVTGWQRPLDIRMQDLSRQY